MSSCNFLVGEHPGVLLCTNSGVVAHLQDKQMNHVFDQSDSRCYELRYCSRLILPAM